MGPGGLRGLQNQWPRPFGRGGGFDSLPLPPLLQAGSGPECELPRQERYSGARGRGAQLLGDHPSVYHELRTSDVGGLIGGQEQDSLSNFLRFGEPAERDLGGAVSV